MGLQSALFAEGVLFGCSQYTGNVIFYFSERRRGRVVRAARL